MSSLPLPREPQPTWAVRTVRCCVAGILGLPVAVPLLLAFAPGADLHRRLGFTLSLAVWIGLFVAAQYLTAVYPPAGRRP